MPQGNGYWYNPDNNVAVEVNRHEYEIKNENTQKKLDLHWAAKEEIDRLPVNKQNEDKIKILAVESGLIRVRDWMKFVSIQLSARRKRLENMLGSIADLIQAFQDKSNTYHALDKDTKAMAILFGTASELRIDNLATQSSQHISPEDFLKTYADAGFLEEKTMKSTDESVHDISMTSEDIHWARKRLAKYDFYKEQDLDILFEDTHVRYSVDNHVSALNEEKLSRVWQLATKDGYVWGIVTGYRAEYDESENIKRNDQLKKDIRKQGYGYWELDGRWQETGEDGTKQDVGERSIFIAAPKDTDGKDFLKFMIDMTQKYDQDAAVYKNDTEGDAPVMLYQYKSIKDGKRVVDEDHFPIGKFNPNKIAENYSKVLGSGRTFVFESIRESHSLKEFINLDGNMISNMNENEIRSNLKKVQGQPCDSWGGSIARSTKLRGLEEALRRMERNR